MSQSVARSQGAWGQCKSSAAAGALCFVEEVEILNRKSVAQRTDAQAQIRRLRKGRWSFKWIAAT